MKTYKSQLNFSFRDPSGLNTLGIHKRIQNFTFSSVSEKYSEEHDNDMHNAAIRFINHYLMLEYNRVIGTDLIYSVDLLDNPF